ncbi:hypothetical protein A2U01_0088140 [Trifolium medium]|uniref:Uncharacterized protein n=1 Tax=Trifolium medium TaxID=97028 RepID=A0A392U0B2_9FABA|nr:hypothetical protein [Trifolium medium]
MPPSLSSESREMVQNSAIPTSDSDVEQWNVVYKAGASQIPYPLSETQQITA